MCDFYADIKNVNSPYGGRYKADKEMLEKYVDVEKIKLGNLDYFYFISTLINSCYSTRMGADRLFATAKLLKKHASKIHNILTRDTLSNDELKTIKKICGKELELSEILEANHFHSYSFITKFLKIHALYGMKREIFPIYDGNVKAVIKKYKLNKIDTLKEIVNSENAKSKEDAIKILEELEKEKTKTKTLDIKNYVLFYKIMSILTIVLGTNFHDLDQAFWKLGKDILDEQRKEKKERKKE